MLFEINKWAGSKLVISRVDQVKTMELKLVMTNTYLVDPFWLSPDKTVWVGYNKWLVPDYSYLHWLHQS